MVSLVLVQLPDALPSCLAGWDDLFSYADRLSIRRGGGAVFSSNLWVPGTPLPPTPHVVLIPARVLEGTPGSEVGSSSTDLRSTLGKWAHEGAMVGAVCAGVFTVAEAGLLNGRFATTHWSLADEFRRRFPKVRLDQDALVIETEDRILGGGMTAYFDVGLRLIRRFAGPEVARDCASIFVLDPDRRLQSPFAPPGLGSLEADPVLAKAVDWASGRAILDFRVADWAAAVAVEKRTLERRAQAAWGFGPAERLRRMRLDRARLLTAGGGLSWDEITQRCGYTDPAAFRRLFLIRFGQSPGEYRRRFGTTGAQG